MTPATAAHRRVIIDMAAAADPALPTPRLIAAVDEVLTNPAVARSLAAALATDPGALTIGAPPSVARLNAALRRAGSVLPEPACTGCGRSGVELARAPDGGICRRCADHRQAAECAACGNVRLVRGRDGQRRPLCGVCAPRPERVCGECGRTGKIIRRGRDGQPDLCAACFRMPEAVCIRCGRTRPCSFASGPEPICASCAPRATAICAHCGQTRPPTARWPEGPVCDPCYNAALRRRGTCAGCGHERRLITPPGPHATTCADCAGQPPMHVCGDCGTEDKLYERGRCDRCALRRRTRQLLSTGTGQIPDALIPVSDAIIATPTPRSALNWLRRGAGAKILGDITAGRLALTHDALDKHPPRQAADYLRHVLVANGALPQRDDALAAAEQFLADTLAGIDNDRDRRLVHAYATWRVLRRLRRTAASSGRPRTVTRNARANITAAVDLLAWLAGRNATLTEAGQVDIDTYLTGGTSTWQARDFLLWATSNGHAATVTIPARQRAAAPAVEPDQRSRQAARLLHDADIDLTDRVAGLFVLLYGQTTSRIAAMTTSQITTSGEQTHVTFGRAGIDIDQPLAGLLAELARRKRPYRGVGSPADTEWLFPGLQPGRPLTAARLGERLHAIGISPRHGRRTALTDLAKQLPAAVLADLLGLHPTTAVNWNQNSGGTWNRYAADLSREHDHEP